MSPRIFTLILVLICLPGISEEILAGNIESRCNIGEAKKIGGIKRMALIVGVGEYRVDRVPDLAGPAYDAKNVYQLLTGENGYGFPVENVCLLVDQDATLDRFNTVFHELLLSQSGANDVAVVYFAGHGSQVPDRNGDEPDDYDETMMFHDYDFPQQGYLLDDDFNHMLAALNKTDAHITVIVDSCNSGSATRGEDSTFTARYFEETRSLPPVASDESLPEGGDGADAWVPESFSGVAILSAASDGTAALEKDARGVFTDALIQVISEVSLAPLTYQQVALRIAPLVSARSYQIPYAQGDLSAIVFGNSKRQQPLSWAVEDLDPHIVLGGPPIPGTGIGAEFRIYDGALPGVKMKDPRNSKAVVVTTESEELQAIVKVSVHPESASAIKNGDRAVLIRPANDFIQLSVRLRAESEADGITKENQEEIRQLLAENGEANSLISIVKDAADFEIRQNTEGEFVTYGPEHRVRNVNVRAKSVVDNLRLHARQTALLQLRGEGGEDFIDQETLQVQLWPIVNQLPCADGTWQQAEPNRDQIIPLCHAYNVKVRHSGDNSPPLLIGGLILSSDGAIYGLPADGRSVKLSSGEEYVFNGRRETFAGAPPLDVRDTILVFGTQETNPVSWHLLSESARQRSVSNPVQSSLYRAIDKYLQPATRGQLVVESVQDNSTWTLSSLATSVEANSRFLKAEKFLDFREYTIANFDIRPYLPEDKSSSLYKVLSTVEKLTHASARDGYGYKQHDWSLPTDAENLKKGIDCSRAIWYAFSRSGLPYNNRGDKYISTASMISANSILSDQFKRCDAEKPALGDVLVYRDDTRGDGHVVMVIDSDKRIAWGSHGWDGNGRQPDVDSDTGVEYQLIKFKKDWERWDRKSMEKKACWRYNSFAEELITGRGLPGTTAFTGDCMQQGQCRFDP